MPHALSADRAGAEFCGEASAPLELVRVRCTAAQGVADGARDWPPAAHKRLQVVPPSPPRHTHTHTSPTAGHCLSRTSTSLTFSNSSVAQLNHVRSAFFAGSVGALARARRRSDARNHIGLLWLIRCMQSRCTHNRASAPAALNELTQRAQKTGWKRRSIVRTGPSGAILGIH